MFVKIFIVSKRIIYGRKIRIKEIIYEKSLCRLMNYIKFFN